MIDLINNYGEKLLDKTELEEIKKDNKIILEYYKIKKYSFNKIRMTPYYGIKIVKKEIRGNRVQWETNSIKQISTNENKISNLIKILKTYQVTPIALNDVLTDLLKTPEYQEF